MSPVSANPCIARNLGPLERCTRKPLELTRLYRSIRKEYRCANPGLLLKDRTEITEVSWRFAELGRVSSKKLVKCRVICGMTYATAIAVCDGNVAGRRNGRLLKLTACT